MDAAHDPFRRANDLFRRADYLRWQRLQTKQHILRSQVGFLDTTPTRPQPCQGCANYHGIAYGTSRATRQVLVCAIHPDGWQVSEICPDWRGDEGRSVL